MNLKTVCTAGWLSALLIVAPACKQDAVAQKPVLQEPDVQEPVVNESVKLVAAEDLWTRKVGEDWPSFLGPRGDGTSSEKGIQPDLWSPLPKIVYTIDLKTSYGGPTLVKGRLLQFDRVNNKERLTCYRAETAEELWHWEQGVAYDDMYGYNNGPRCSPVVDGDLVYCYGVAGNLSCVTLADGKLVWTRDLVQEFGVIQNFFGVASTPKVDGDRLLVMVGGSPKESQFLPPGRLDMVKPNGTAILALDKRTGRELYRVGDDLASYSSPMTCELNGRKVGLAFLRSGLLGWDAAEGKELFRFEHRARMLESVNASQPIVHDNQVFVSETYQIGSVMLRPKVDQQGKWSVETVWKDGDSRSTQAFRAHWSTPALIDGYLYGCSGRNQPDSDFRCIRWSDGKVMWTDRRHERSSVLHVDGYLIVLGEEGQLELLKPNPEKMERIKAVDLSRMQDKSDNLPLIESPAWAAPVLSHGLLFIRGNTKLICLDLIPQ